MSVRSYLRRSHRINQTALQLARWLHVHPLVQRVYYPGVTYGADGQPGKEGSVILCTPNPSVSLGSCLFSP